MHISLNTTVPYVSQNSAAFYFCYDFVKSNSFLIMFTVMQLRSRGIPIGALKTREWKRRDWKTRHRTAGLKNARLEKAAPNCRDGKCEIGKRGTKTAGVENARLENAVTSFLWKAKRVF